MALFFSPRRLTGASIVLLMVFPLWVLAQTEKAASTDAAIASTLDTLDSFAKLRDSLLEDIKSVSDQLKDARSDDEKSSLKAQLDKLQADLRTTGRNFENIAAGVDISRLRELDKDEFNFQREVFALLKPAIDEMKDMTSHVRQKSDLKEKIAIYEEKLPILGRALENVTRLQVKSGGRSIDASLKGTADNWRKQQAFMESELKAAKLQLNKLEESETSIAEASQGYLKSFFQRRGLYITVAILVVAAVMLLSRLSYAAMRRFMPGYRAPHRSFRIRLIDLLHRVLTAFFAVVGPMVVFYLVEDWVLFSLGILILLGVAWTLRQALPRYWHQVQLFLNVGSVREGERIVMDGIPWMVQQINVFSTLVNPTAEIVQRVPINDLVDKKSRPYKMDEPWFPCKRGDWVTLNDGVRGQVISISPEYVQLVERGAARYTYGTGDFLGMAPRNLDQNFRFKTVLGLSYGLQKDITTTIPQTLKEYIQKRANDEGYGESLLNLLVEFGAANTSSLDVVVVTDFSGSVADIYGRLTRSVQRWCVDACNEYGWEIPFPQLTVHGQLGGVG